MASEADIIHALGFRLIETGQGYVLAVPDGLVRGATPEEVRMWLLLHTPQKDWHDFGTDPD